MYGVVVVVVDIYYFGEGDRWVVGSMNKGDGS
jgi:hypothetical protein